MEAEVPAWGARCQRRCVSLMVDRHKHQLLGLLGPTAWRWSLPASHWDLPAQPVWRDVAALSKGQNQRNI